MVLCTRSVKCHKLLTCFMFSHICCPLTSIYHPLGSICRPLGSIYHPLASTGHPLASIYNPLGSTGHPLGSIYNPLGSTGHPLASICCPLVSICCPLVSICRPLVNRSDLFCIVLFLALNPLNTFLMSPSYSLSFWRGLGVRPGFRGLLISQTFSFFYRRNPF